MQDTHLSDKTEDKHKYSTDNSRAEKKVSLNKLNVKKYKDNNDGYRKYNWESPKSGEILIKNSSTIIIDWLLDVNELSN